MFVRLCIFDEYEYVMNARTYLYVHSHEAALRSACYVMCCCVSLDLAGHLRRRCRHARELRLVHLTRPQPGRLRVHLQ